MSTAVVVQYSGTAVETALNALGTGSFVGSVRKGNTVLIWTV